MKALLVVSALSLLLFSCTGPASTDHAGAKNTAIIEQYVDAVERGDYDGIAALIADDYLGYGPSIVDTTNKADGLASWKYNLENIYDKIEYTRSRFIATTITDGDHPGDWVSHWGFASITYKDGRGPIHLWANTLYKVEDGKIAESLTIYNEYDVHLQLELAEN